jgi:hypothetical protein
MWLRTYKPLKKDSAPQSYLVKKCALQSMLRCQFPTEAEDVEQSRLNLILLSLEQIITSFSGLWIIGPGQEYSRTLDCEQLGLRVFYNMSKNFEGILTW